MFYICSICETRFIVVLACKSVAILDNCVFVIFKVGCSIADYAAPVWSTNASNTSIEKIQVAQNEALRISTGAHKMANIDHLHCEAQMLKVTEHSDLLSAQYLVKCLDHENVCHNITTLDQPPCMMKHTLYSKHHTTIAPLLADTTKESLKESRQSTQRLSPNQEGNRQSIEYYAIDHLTSAKLRLHSEDRKGPLSPRLAPMWQQSGTLIFCSCHGIAGFLVDELHL